MGKASLRRGQRYPRDQSEKAKEARYLKKCPLPHQGQGWTYSVCKDLEGEIDLGYSLWSQKGARRGEASA